jgi:hypothetical protein
VLGPRPPRRQVSRPGHGGSAHAPARQTSREHSPGSPARRPLRGRVRVGSQGTLGLFLTWPGTPFRRQITNRRRTDVTAPMATAPGRARQEAPPGTDGPAARVTGARLSPAEPKALPKDPGQPGRPGSRARLLVLTTHLPGGRLHRPSCGTTATAAIC